MVLFDHTFYFQTESFDVASFFSSTIHN